MPDTMPDPLIGTRIREYEILEVIGKGGMGAVYRARHVYLEEHRAIKVIHARLAQDPEFINRFIREARILVKLSHPNLIRLHEFGTLEEGIFFMVLELLQGESVLDRILRIKRIPVEDAVRIVREAALGLHSAHQKGIVHRDISPDNLLLVKNEAGKEITKVLDFGIAKPNFEASMTAVNMFIGKLEYASPEQCGAGDGTVDERSDVYSLGATFYHMLTGQLPFYSKTPGGYILKHAREKPGSVTPHLTENNMGLALDRIILRSMAKSKDERLASMEALVADLDGLGLQEGTLVVEKTQAQAQPPFFTEAPTPEIGTMFAHRYHIDSVIGKGGMGKVFKATDRFLDVPVALKIVNAIQDDRTLQRFKREVILARKVAHPNVCRTIDIGEFNGTHYVSMDFIEGLNLNELLTRDGRMTPEQGLPLVRQILRALEEAHRVGIVHRDLKPQNIMIDSQKRAFIMDFGISISSDSERLTQAGAIVGTVQYMSPEQIEGHEIDHRSDIYSMGVILFELFTGRLPFGGNAINLLYAHVKLQPEKPSNILPGFPPELERIILKTLEKDPARRFQSVAELLQALEASTGGPVAAVAPEEMKVHRLLSEKNYSQALAELKPLIVADPENQEWKRLWKFAHGEMLLREVRRAESFIRKKDLAKAETILGKIRRLEPGKSIVRRQVRGLMNKIQHRRQEEVTALLDQAETLLARRDWEGVHKFIEDAVRILPDDPRIEPLRERLYALQRNEVPSRYHGVLQEIESDLAHARADESETTALLRLQEASARLEQARKELPGLERLDQLHREIEALQTERVEERALKQKLAPVFDRLAVADVARATELIGMLSDDAMAPVLSANLQRIRSAVEALAACITAHDYSDAEERLQAVISSDGRKWLQSYDNALAQLKEFLQRENSREDRFRTLFHKGKESFEAHRWQEAIQIWKQSLELFPDDAAVPQWLRLAEERVKEELEARTKLVAELNRCGVLIAEREWETVRSTLDSAEKTIRDYHWEDLRPMLTSIRDQFGKVVDQEKTRKQTIERLLQQAQQLSGQERYSQAKQALQSLLDLEPEHAQAKTMLQHANQEIEREMARRKAEAEAEAVKPARSPLPIIAGAAAVLLLVLLGAWFAMRPTEAKAVASARELSQQGRVEDGLSVLREYLKDHPDSPQAQQLVVELEAQLKQQEIRREAEAAFRVARQQRDAKNWDASIRSYELALRLDPANAEAKRELEEVRKLKQAGQTEGQLEPLLVSAREALGQKQFDRAEKIAGEAKKVAPDHPDVKLLEQQVRDQKSRYISDLIAEASALQSQKKLPAAEAALQRVLALEPDHVQARQLLAEVRKAQETFGQGTISIQCEPFCRVFIDGKDMGDSPYARKPISAGTHTIQARKPGFREVSEKVVIRNGDVVDRYFTLEKQ